MIPSIESIVEMLIAEECTAQQALSWIEQHMEDQSLRDSFAGFALQGLIERGFGELGNSEKAYAKLAYKYADAMLKARK